MSELTLKTVLSVFNRLWYRIFGDPSTERSSISADPRFIAQIFSNPIPIKHGEDNFLPRKQQNTSCRIHCWRQIPKIFNAEDETHNRINEDHANWEQEDQFMLSGCVQWAFIPNLERKKSSSVFFASASWSRAKVISKTIKTLTYEC